MYEDPCSAILAEFFARETTTNCVAGNGVQGCPQSRAGQPEGDGGGGDAVKALTECANGDRRPVCAPSKVLCRECLDALDKKFQSLAAPAPKPAVTP